ncbi:MAG TPA: AAA family ATPase [Pseudolabrys sp.]
MTRYEPTLIVTRLVVERNERAVYDGRFHEGVNVISGTNSSGKSTVLNFIYYGLGGDLADWSAVARLCTRVIVEIRINGHVGTVSRDISVTSTLQPMDIFAGDYEASHSAPRSEWARYPYRSTQNRESFSQALFRLLGIPEVSSDLSGHITMHQMLRLLYADQLSPIEQLFRFESFDRADLRDTVGRLLCGAYESTVYDNDQRIRALSKEFDEINGQMKSLFSVLGRAEQGFTFEWIDAERRRLEADRDVLDTEISDAEAKIFSSAGEDELTLSQQESAYADVQQLQTEIGAAKGDKDALVLTIADSDAFIRSLRQKVEALSDSSRVVSYIGDVRFQNCPACYAPIEELETGHACHLCKTPFDSQMAQTRVTSLIMDAGVQIKQSEQLQSRRQERLSDLSARIEQLGGDWKKASRKLSTLQMVPSTAERQRLRDLHRRYGYVERQIDDLEHKAELAETVRELSERKDTLNYEIGRLRNANEALRAQQVERLGIAKTKISDELATLLRHDLRRQDIFEDPKEVRFAFSDNRVTVDDENYFSASSRAILKSSFFLAFLAAATKVPFFRHPRFCMIDTLENMGVEPIRSHNFQLQILRVSQESLVEHQIIYATAMIAPELDESAYVVGALSTIDEMTIGIKI